MNDEAREAFADAMTRTLYIAFLPMLLIGMVWLVLKLRRYLKDRSG